MAGQEEQTLVQQAREGSKTAFAQLIEANQKRIYHLAFRMTGNHDDALDVSQETFLKAWQALPNFKGDSSFSTWLYRLCSNASIDLLRKKQRRPESSLSKNFPEEDEGVELEIPDSRFSPENALVQKELGNFIQEGLGLLPDHHRQVLIMREMSGLSYQEISTTLDLDIGTVKSRIARARSSLRTFLQKKGMK